MDNNVLERLLGQQHALAIAPDYHLVAFGIVFGVVAFLFLLAGSWYSAKDSIDAPLVGKQWPYEPTFYTRTRFYKGAWQVIHEGFLKVSWTSDAVDTATLVVTAVLY